MHKAFLKNQVRTLSLGLLIASTPAFAAYSTDPDCAEVSNAARESSENASAAYDNVAQSTAASIAKAKSCVDQVLSQSNRAVSNFDFGRFTEAAGELSKNLATQACQLISQAQKSATSGVTNKVNSATSGMPSTVSNAATQATAPAVSSATNSIWSRFANLF